MKYFPIAAATAACAIFAFSGNASAAEYTMKLAASNQKLPNHFIYTAVERFESEVKKRSGGRIDVEIYWGGSLGKVETVLDLVRKGMVEGTFASDGHVAPYYKDVQVLSVPYLFGTRAVAWDVLGGKWGRDFSDAMGKASGIRPIGIMENGGYRHFSANTPLKSADDLVGLKIRTQTSPIHMGIAKSLGASPTPIAWADLYTSLQTGVVDGEENSLGTFRLGKLEEVQKHIIMDGHVYSITFLLVSEKFYKSLPADLQQVLQEAARDAVEVNHEIAVANESLDREYLRSKGVSIVDISDAEKMRFRKLTQEPALAMLKEQGIDQALLGSLLDTIDKSEAVQSK